MISRKNKSILIAFFTLFSIFSWQINAQQDSIYVHINLNDLSNDTFKVSIKTNGLTQENDTYYFAKTAPGTYSTMNFGDYVTKFEVLDKDGKAIGYTKPDINSYQIDSIAYVSEIKYEIQETFDHPRGLEIYPMAGTSIEADHALINTFAVTGYFKGRQENPIALTLDYPENWLYGSALPSNNKGTFYAESFDYLADSPILIGELTRTTYTIDETDIEVAVYSQNKTIQAETILNDITDVINGSKKYLGTLPVDHYSFLFFFETNDITPKGALEHSYCSLYTSNEKPWDEISESMRHVIAHEFFHIVTPLNLHSEYIETFNFNFPRASEHLWLYEGVTEWAAHMILLKNKLVDLDTYLLTLRKKAFVNDQYFDPTWSLIKLSKESYSKEGFEQYSNIYMKGALFAGILDIRILELSKGKQGLIDVIKELTEIYGKQKAFQEDELIPKLVEITYPEIQELFDDYVYGTAPLPLEEYYAKIGIIYNSSDYMFSVDPNATKKQRKLRNKWMKLQ